MNLEQDNLGQSILEQLRLIREELKSLKEELHNSRISTDKINLPASPNLNLQSETAGNFVGKDPQRVINWFKERQVLMTGSRQQEPADEPIDKLAIFLGDNYPSLVQFHRQLAYKYRNREFAPFIFNFSSWSESDAKILQEYCSRIKAYAFAEIWPIRNEKSFRFTPHNLERASHFFSNGGWFERYVHRKISELVSQTDPNYTSLVNAKVKLPTGRNSELDAFYLVNGQPLWIECKTGDIGDNLGKYLGMREPLGVPKQQAFIVFLDKSLEEVNDLTALYEISVVNQANFLTKIQETFRQSATLPRPEKAPSVVPEKPNPVAEVKAASPGLAATDPQAILMRYQLDPLPRHRKQLIRELIDMITIHPTRPIAELKANLANKTGELSVGRVQHFLNALIEKKCLLNQQGQPLSQSDQREIVSGLTSFDFQTLEDTCLEILR